MMCTTVAVAVRVLVRAILRAKAIFQAQNKGFPCNTVAPMSSLLRS